MRASARFIGALAPLVLAVALRVPAVAFADVMPSPAASRSASARTYDSSKSAEASAAIPDYLPERGGIDVDAFLYSFEGLALVPLLLTVVIETPIVAIVGRFTKTAWQVGFLVNTLTNPVAVVLVKALWPQTHLGPSDWLDPLVVGAIEIGVVAVEARVFTSTLRWPWRKAFVVSLLANLASFGAGNLIIGI